MNITGIYDTASVSNSVSNNTISGALIGIYIWSHSYGAHTSGYGIDGLVIEKNSIRINQASYAGSTFPTATGGITVNPNGDLACRNVKIANNVIVFDTENSVIRGSTASIGIGWWSTQSQAAENWSVENNRIDNAPVAGIRIAGALIRDSRIVGNIIRNAGSSLDPAIYGGYKLPLFIGGSSRNLMISNNSISDTFTTTRILYAVALYGTSQSSGIVLCNNTVSVTGTDRSAFLGNLYIGDASTDSSAQVAWNQCGTAK
jgi:parallel beta-helix repeat protein